MKKTDWFLISVIGASIAMFAVMIFLLPKSL